MELLPQRRLDRKRQVWDLFQTSIPQNDIANAVNLTIRKSSNLAIYNLFLYPDYIKFVMLFWRFGFLLLKIDENK